MNDTMSLLLVSILLSAGGLGLYMYKLSNDDEDYNEDKLFTLDGGFISRKDEKNENEKNGNESTFEEDLEIFEPKINSRGGKTKRRKTTGGSKRKY
jgi:hypothetical protein